MIKVFGATDKSFVSNGDAVLHPLKAKVRKEDNGAFYLDLETGLEYADYLVEGNIIVATLPQGDQAFRVTNPTKTRSKITVRAYHVFFDSKNYLIADSYVVDKNCNDALDHLNNATEPSSQFTTLSDVAESNSFRCVRKSLYEAIKTVIERWGGHLVMDNFHIEIRNSIGRDNGVTVRYRKNLKEITCQETWNNVVTKLLPVGKDGLLLPELYVVSETQYVIPYTKTVSFTQDTVLEEDYQDPEGNTDQEAYEQALIEDLRQQAQAYVDANCVPQVSYTLKANLERITDVGDTIEVIDERLGIDIMTNLIAFTYDCILGKYTELEFGNFKKTISGLVSNITASTEAIVEKQSETIKVTLSEELKASTSQILDFMGESNVIYDGDKILVLDQLPKEDARNVIMINSQGIGFSSTGINGTFNSAWTIDGTLDMQQINVINLVADMIKGGTLKLGSHSNASGILEVYDDGNNLVGVMDKNGLKIYGVGGSYVVINDIVGLAGYDKNGNKKWWSAEDEFHMKKSVVEEEITLCNQLRFIPIQITDSNNNVVNEGIGLVSAYTGGN